MKFNETLLIGLALVAALVFSKGGAASSIFKKSSVPYLPLENKTISFMENFPFLETFKQFFPVKETNVQLYNIRDIEEKQKLLVELNKINKDKEKATKDLEKKKKDDW